LAQEVISLEDAAAIAGLSVAHMRFLARNGRIEARKVGRDWVTTKSAVERYIHDEKARSRNPYKGTRPRRRTLFEEPERTSAKASLDLSAPKRSWKTHECVDEFGWSALILDAELFTKPALVPMQLGLTRLPPKPPRLTSRRNAGAGLQDAANPNDVSECSYGGCSGEVFVLRGTLDFQ